MDTRGVVYVADGNMPGDVVDFGDGVLEEDELALIWVVSYAPDGALRWRRSFFPFVPSGLARGTLLDVAVGAGCVAIVGSFSRGSVDFGRGLRTPVDLAAGGVGSHLEDSFVVCLDPESGETLWDVHIGGIGTDRAWEVAIDAEGNVAVAGRLFYTSDDGWVQIGTTRYSSSADGETISYLAVFDSSGNLRWSRSLDAPYAEVESGRTGHFLFAVAADRPLDPGGGIAGPPPGVRDIAPVIVAYDVLTGAYRWQLPLSFASVSSLRTTRGGTVVSGSFLADELRVGSLTLEGRGGVEDAAGFVLEVSESGEALSLEPRALSARGLGVQRDGGMIVGTDFRDDIDFGGCLLAPDVRPASGEVSQDGLVISLDPEGRCEWALPLSSYAHDPTRGHQSIDSVSDVQLGPDDAPVFVGRFNGSVAIGDLTITGEAPGIYVAKLEPD